MNENLLPVRDSIFRKVLTRRSNLDDQIMDLLRKEFMSSSQFEIAHKAYRELQHVLNSREHATAAADEIVRDAERASVMRVACEMFGEDK